MKFSQAMEVMEKGFRVTRPKWEGFLFLDMDGNIRYHGTKKSEYNFFAMDVTKSDWEQKMDDKINLESAEVTQARLESLMDNNSSHIKRLYYLEEMISSQHKAMKVLSDGMTAEMDETRKSLAGLNKGLPKIEKIIKDISDAIIKYDLKELSRSVSKLLKENNKDNKKENKTKCSESERISEEKEMTQIKEKIEERKKFNAGKPLKSAK